MGLAKDTGVVPTSTGRIKFVDDANELVFVEQGEQHVDEYGLLYHNVGDNSFGRQSHQPSVRYCL